MPFYVCVKANAPLFHPATGKKFLVEVFVSGL